MTSTSGRRTVSVSGPIRSDSELDQATRELCRVISLGSALTGFQRQKLNCLTKAIEAYEKIHYPIPSPTNAGMLEHLLDAKGKNPSQLAKATGIPRGDITEVLHGHRDIRPDEAIAFSQYFNVDQTVFECPVVNMEVHATAGGSAGFRAQSDVTITATSIAAGAKLADKFFSPLWGKLSRLGPEVSVPSQTRFGVACE